MSDDRRVALALTVEAAKTVTVSRPGVHGSAENSFAMIGELWTTYLRHVRKVRKSDEIRPEDVAQMMSMLKKARAIYGDTKNRDNFVDDLGYTSLAGMLQLPEQFDANMRNDQEALDQMSLDLQVQGDGA